MDELKPCPFCGTPVELAYNQMTGQDYYTHVDWNSPCVARPFYGTFSAWNTRPVEDALRVELAQQAELHRMEREALIGAWNETSRQLRAEIGQLRALLTQLEWITPRESWFWQYTQPKYCQLCGRFRHQGHAPDCKLAALLGAQGAQ